MTNPRILIIEDDQIQAEDLKHSLERLGSPVEVISTEAQFRKRLKEADVERYSLAVVDMMLRWTDPAPDMELPPSDVIEEGSYTAGLRCCRSLASRGVRCIIFTALSPSAIPRKPSDDFEIIHKGGGGYATLLDRIRPLGR
ncbi:MAG: hypothetical protein ABSH49_27330 [Bryobacteraceae bacterium]|jgi:CheY-like chemotaxis protein